MRLRIISVSVIAALLSLYNYQIYSANIGSDSAVTRFNTQQTIFNTDRVASFAALAGGFNIFGALTVGTWDSFFGTSGKIDFSTGTLILKKDLIFQDVAEFSTIGNIIGNGHTIEFAPTMTVIQTHPQSAGNCIVSQLGTSLTAGRDLESIAFSNDDQFLAFSMGEDRAGAPNGAINIYSISPANGLTLLFSTTLSPEAASGSPFIIGTQVDFRPTATMYQFAFTRGNVASPNEELIIFNYDPTVNNLFRIDGRSFASPINALACRYHPSGNFLAIVQGNIFGDYSGYPAANTNTADANARIRIYSVSATGVLTETTDSIANPGNLYTLGKTIRPRTLEWDPTGNFLAVGTTQLNGSGSGAGGPTNLYVFNFSAVAGGAVPGALTSLNATALTPQPGVTVATAINDVRGMDWHPTFTDYMAVVGNGNGGQNNVLIFRHNAAGGTLTLQTVTGNATRNLNNNAIATRWSIDGGCIGIGKAVTGAGDPQAAFRIYTFKKTGVLLDMNYSATFIGATEIEAFAYGKGGTLLATGDDTPVINSYITNSFIPVCSIWSDVNLVLNNNMSFSNVCITFTGDSVINGQGHCLTLNSTSTVIVGSNSSLLIKDITVVGLHNNFIQCTDATSTITFKSVNLDLDGNYSFTVGHFDVFADLRIVGDGFAFIYQSPSVSTVQSDGRIILDHGLTFSYAPPTANRDLLQLVDSTAQLYLNGATLLSTTTGLRLTRGQLIIDRQSSIISGATVLSQAVSFGDGVNLTNNLDIQVLPGAQLVVKSGIVAYNNV